MTSQPNFLIFMPETVRADFVFGTKGIKAQTPNIDQFAAEGISFSNCFSISPYCTPSRCSIFTGLYPHVRGHRALMHLLHEDERNLFMDLKEAGYETVCFGKNDLVAGKAIEMSFDETALRVKPEPSGWKPPARARDDKHFSSFYIGRRDPGAAHDFDWACIQSALDFIGGRHDKPFCLFLPLHFAHPPYVVEEPFFSRHPRSEVKKPLAAEFRKKSRVLEQYFNARNLDRLDEQDLIEIRATYQGMISRLDAQFGLLLDKLETCGLAGSTSVFLFSDHGDYAGDYGQVEKVNYSFDDCLLHIPLIARLPGGAGGLRRNGFIEGVDLYPTVMELAGIEPRHQHFGRSIGGLFNPEAEDMHRDCVFAEAGFSKDEPQSYTPLGHVAGGPYEATNRMLASRPGFPGRRVMIRTARWKYVYSREGLDDELYDLQADPGETRNLEAQGFDRVKQEMKERILQWLVDTSDVVPLVHDGRGFSQL